MAKPPVELGVSFNRADHAVLALSGYYRARRPPADEGSLKGPRRRTWSAWCQVFLPR